MRCIPGASRTSVVAMIVIKALYYRGLMMNPRWKLQGRGCRRWKPMSLRRWLQSQGILLFGRCQVFTILDITMLVSSGVNNPQNKGNQPSILLIYYTAISIPILSQNICYCKILLPWYCFHTSSSWLFQYRSRFAIALHKQLIFCGNWSPIQKSITHDFATRGVQVPEEK